MLQLFESLLGHSLVDKLGGMVELEKEHAMVHLGKAYRLRISNSALANGASLTLHLNIPKNVFMHLKEVEFFSEGKSAFLFNVGGSFSGGSNSVTPVSLNQIKNIPSKIFAETSFSQSGSPVVLESFTAGGGTTNATRVPGEISSEWEWNFSGQDVAITLTNNTGSAAVAWISLNWYETY